METALLLWNENGKDEDGFPKETRNSAEVYASKKSVKWAEVYDAMRAGVSVEMILELRVEDWELSAHMVNGQKEYARKVQYDGREYDIIRAYERPKSKIELTCG